MVGEGLYDVDLGVEGGQPVVWVRGEVDVNARTALQRAVEGARRQAPRVVIDVSGTTFLDGCVLGALLRLSEEEGRDAVIVRGPPARVRRLLWLTGVDGFVTVVPPEPDACPLLGQRAPRPAGPVPSDAVRRHAIASIPVTPRTRRVGPRERCHRPPAR